MARKIGRGKALTELVKGSLEYTIEAIQGAVRSEFVPDDAWFPRVLEVFAAYVIVWDPALAQSEYYRVGYEREGEGFVFAPRGEWEVVELTYQPQTVAESRRPPSVPPVKGTGGRTSRPLDRSPGGRTSRPPDRGTGRWAEARGSAR